MKAAPDELVPGGLVRVAAGVQRLLAPNASLMTGPGTNSYLIGEPPVAVLDPGPDEPAHVDSLLRAAPRPRFVFVTHTHRDHSSAARRLAAATGAPIVGLPPPADGRQDETCVPDVRPADGEVFLLNPEARPQAARAEEGSGAVRAKTASPGHRVHRLRAIHTPGHASNHVCFFLEEDGLLFSGDHVLDGMTPVILAPDGDMAEYLRSLERLKTYALRAIAPGHGRVLADPVGTIDRIIAHRGRRERRVVAALERQPESTLDELLRVVYDDVRAELLPIARLSLEAHLIKLAREGRARREGERWMACRE